MAFQSTNTVMSVKRPGDAARRLWTAYALVAVFLVSLSSVPVVMPAVTEPGEPDSVTLHVKSGSDLVVDFAKPLSDGGSQITSYKVEWDTNPGIREIQDVTTTVFTGPNEIQLIRSSALAVDEVQVVHTNAPDINEVQTITTSADNEELLGGSFTVTFDTTSLGGGPFTSGPILHNAGAMAGDGPSRTTMEEILEAMPNIGDVTVVRGSVDTEGGYTWTVTFLSEEKNIPQLTLGSNALTGTGADVQFVTVQEGNEIGGTFTLGFEDGVTLGLNWDASEEEMQNALQFLPGIDTVEVVRTDETLQGGYVWLITFTSDVNHGSLATLVPTSSLTGVNTTIVVCAKGATSNGASDPCDGRSVEGNEIGGTFALVGGRRDEVQVVTVNASNVITAGSFRLQYEGGSVSSLLDILTVTQATVATEVEALVGEPVSVIKSLEVDGSTQASFEVTFLGPEGDELGGGDKSELTVLYDGSGCAGCVALAPSDATMAISTLFEGELGEKADGIPYDASVADITSRLEFLNPIQGVEVVRSGPDSERGYEWTVTFTSREGDVPALRSNVSALTGLSSAVDVSEVHKGTVQEIQIVDLSSGASQVGGNFTLSFRGMTTEELVMGSTCGESSDVEAELERLATVIGDLTVECQTNGAFGLKWTITFETNAGDLPLLTADDSELTPADATITITTDRDGTSLALGGTFALEFDGQRSGYLDYDASAQEFRDALQALSTVGTVEVARLGPDENSGYTWRVTFQTDLGDNPAIAVDDSTLTGSFARGLTTESLKGIGPPFNSGTGGLSLGSFTITDLEALTYTITDLKQGVPYFARVAATNAIGFSPARLATPPMALPFPRAFVVAVVVFSGCCVPEVLTL